MHATTANVTTKVERVVKRDSDEAKSKISGNLNINAKGSGNPSGKKRKEELTEENNSTKSSINSNVSSLHSSDDDDYDDDEDEGYSEELQPENLFPEQVELQGYTLIEKVGEGAFSKVFRAVPQRNGPTSFLCENYKEVAIKIIKKTALVGDDPKADIHVAESHNRKHSKTSSKEQVLKEVSLHKAVSSGCPQIVQFIDFQESKTYYYIVQELIHGGEIFGEIVKYTYFSEDLSRHVIKQLALAVQHLHSLGVVHRDIKPENLLFEPIEFIPSKEPKLRKSDDPSTKSDEGLFVPGVGGGGIGVVKLADFGLSKQIFATNTKTPCGTVGYTAPEVVKDEHYSMKVDMWGVGCVLYTMLCGFPPFYDEKIDVLTEKISRGEYTFLRPWWDEISAGAKNAVIRLLEVDPNKRYDIDEFLEDPWLNTYDCLKEQEEDQRREIENMEKKKRKSHRHKMYNFQRDASILYSPAAVAMRDAFDISNAVQRIEEDRRVNTPTLGALAEDEEEEFSNELNHEGVNGLEQDMFQLKLNSATIIKRRQEKKHLAENVPVEPIKE